MTFIKERETDPRKEDDVRLLTATRTTAQNKR
jgi:hypothetical protein